MITGKYPGLRLRRSRKYDWSRRLVEENNLTPNDFILPIFLIDGKNKKLPIKSMPGVYRYTLDKLNLIVKMIGNISIPISTNKPGNKKINLCLKFINIIFWIYLICGRRVDGHNKYF